jgi:hypothetical protein
MSSITRMVIYAASSEDEAMARLNAWCAEHDSRGQQFGRLDEDTAGGYKVFTSQVWAMAGNYFAHEDLVEVFGSFGWRYPRRAVLIVDDEHTEHSQVVTAEVQ